MMRITPFLRKQPKPFSALPGGLIPAIEASRLLGIPKEAVANWRKLLQRNLSEREFASIPSTAICPFEVKDEVCLPMFGTGMDDLRRQTEARPVPESDENKALNTGEHFTRETNRIFKILFGKEVPSTLRLYNRDVEKGAYLISTPSSFIHRDAPSENFFSFPSNIVFSWSSKDDTLFMKNSLKARQWAYIEQNQKPAEKLPARMKESLSKKYIVISTDQHFHGAIPARTSGKRLFLRSEYPLFNLRYL